MYRARVERERMAFRAVDDPMLIKDNITTTKVTRPMARMGIR